MNAAIHMASTEKLITGPEMVSPFCIDHATFFVAAEPAGCFGMAGKGEGKADGPPGDASTCAGSGAESLEVPECDG